LERTFDSPSAIAASHARRAHGARRDRRRRVELSHRVGQRGRGPQSPLRSGAPLAFVRESNPYREGCVVVAIAAFRERLCDAGNQLLAEFA
jgi:hypothetical protein